MSSEEALADRLRRALYVYKAEERELDHADEDELVEEALQELEDTMDQFLEGEINFATVKYRLDDAFVRTGYAFPPREVIDILRTIVLSVDVDDLIPAMRKLGRMPEDLSDAKGALLDAEEFIQQEGMKGTMDRSLLEPLTGLLLCLWHLQAPSVWPVRHPALLDLFRRCSLVGNRDPVDNTVDYLLVVLSISEASGALSSILPRLIPLLEEELPPAEQCLSECLERARTAMWAKEWDVAIEWWDLALSFAPHEREAMEGLISSYLGKGLHMMAVAEAEALVEAFPRDQKAHRQLLALYKGRRMVEDYNQEVLRYRALMRPTPNAK